MNAKINKIIDNILKYIILAIFVVPIGVVLLIYASTWIDPEGWGSYNLGNNLYWIYWEKDYRYMVFSGDLDGRVCRGGWTIIPTSGSLYDNDGNFKESVISAKANSNWIIAETVDAEKEKTYYIISKDFDYKGLKKIYNEMSVDSIRYQKFIEAIEKVKKDNMFTYNDSNRFIHECILRDIDLRFD